MTITQAQIEDLDVKIGQWLELDIDAESRIEIKKLQLDKKYDILQDKFGERIAFGTAGLRAAMTSGFAYMNDVTVLQAAQGLVQYVIDNCTTGNELSIVVGYDHRHNSQRYAELTASAALNKGVKVYYLGSIDNLSETSIKYSKGEFDNTSTDGSYVHTPMVPFTIDEYGASAGVMITASHNPAQDNGYKVYYSNGCQIIPPHDHGIAESIMKNLQPWHNVWNVGEAFKLGIESGNLVGVKPEMEKKYVERVEDLISYTKLGFNFVYTPMHGVGQDIFMKCLKKFTLYNVATVGEQELPNPDFPTVKFPNPEEKGALDIAIAHANKISYNLVLANDPDADRFSCAYKSHDHKWHQLTGNEIGFLFAMYIIENTPKHKLCKTYLINSTVSSQILDSMANIEGFNFIDTLTGFKWIGNKAIALKDQGYDVPFAYEEAIGFMFNIVNDKDGISAAIIFLQLYSLWFAKGHTTVEQKLKQGYEKYGYYKECNGYYRLDDVAKTNQIFAGIRNSYSGHEQPTTIGDFEVMSFRDLTIGYDSTKLDHVPSLPTDPNSQMITAVLRKGSSTVRFTCRGSGTEPKLKVYIEGQAKKEKDATNIAKECWDLLRTHWFKPEVYNLLEVLN